jgi:hypothetical protein
MLPPFQKQKSRNDHLSIGEEAYEEHREYLKQRLDKITEMKRNSEKSLQLLMDKFIYLFNWKKWFISEIERLDREIKELTIILNQ